MEALGRLFNIASVVAPVDLAGGAQTGARVRLNACSGVAFVYFADAGTAGEDVDLDVQEHNAASAGTSQDLDVVTRWFSKRETTLDNDEQWTKHTQTAASEVDLGDDEGEAQVIAVVEVSSKDLTDGYEWVSVNTTDSGATAGKLGCVLAITYDLTDQRSPELLADLL
ncbi:hypothetical protein K4749_01335 [Streptomyces sp. TRM72054]|uniref:hypothetical protein n=1 Tax=Streptomyces sp. TRM72054 TaxID=2870562 RepID=UPI001C8BF668|nr:hypothetical protein [Streptomyces sp. TRM72054]MBX9392274.1 hypothetical protein [Streptomyces sp. TRM72054]